MTEPKPDAGKAKPVQEYVVTQHGSGPFRAFNFELYAVSTSRAEGLNCHARTQLKHTQYCVQKPTGFMRLAAYAGTTAFVSVLGYMIYEKNRLEGLAKKGRG